MGNLALVPSRDKDIDLKVLHVSDIHFNKQQFNWISANYNQYQLLCISGDILDDSHQCKTNISDQIRWIQNWTNSIDIPLLICSGNHDEHSDEEQQSPFEWIKTLKQDNIYVDNDIVNIEGWRVGCVPYDCEHLEPFKQCDVLLSHTPPAKLKVAKQKSPQYQNQDWGCENLREAISSNELAAKYFLCGHIHQPIARFSKFKTRIISNPGNSPTANVPNYNILNLKR